MQKFGKSQTTTRVEDPRHLTGQGRFVADIVPDGALIGYFLRSPVAHGTITTLDVGDARDAEGVHLVLTGADMDEAGVDRYMTSSLLKLEDGSKAAKTKRPILARNRVRFVGEAVALIVAETLEQAMDAAELIELDIDELEPALALAPGEPTLHDSAPNNVSYQWGLGDKAKTDAAFAQAAHVVTLEVPDNRIIVASMETRGAYSEWTKDDRLHVCVNGQGVWGMRDDLSDYLKLPVEQVRVTTPDVGGGFGMKGFAYPEYFAIAHATQVTKKTIAWQSGRMEAMLTDNGGRSLVSTSELAFDADYKITGYRVSTVSDLGAYNSGYAQFIQSELFAKVLTGVYDIPTVRLEVQGIYTNTTPVDAYRGAGRPEAIYVLERSMDNAARVLGVDGWDLRMKNFIPNEAFPYRTLSDQLYDVGDFPRVLNRVRTVSDAEGFESRKSKSAEQGRLRGIGLSYYIESILGDASEHAAIEYAEDGMVELLVGTQSNGQGHETVYAQFLSDQSGIPMDRIRIVQGDSDRIPKGGGTGGSRSVTIQTSATQVTLEQTIETLKPFVADELGVEAASVAFEDGAFRSEGSNRTPGLVDVFEMARDRGRDDLLVHRARYQLDGRSYPNGAHVAEVEIDPETGQVEVVKYSVTDDFGNLLHPTLVEGQVHGGVAQGLGQALSEHVVYDENGQLLTASFMDYGMPRADNMPMITFTTEPVPATGNIMGMKGCGEAGTVGALGAISNAVLDALWSQGIRHANMPFTPHRVWSMLNEAKGAAG